MRERNCLTYWLPKLQAAGVPVPRTEVVDAGEDWADLCGLFDNPTRHPESHGKADALCQRLATDIWAAADRLGGYPVFLRTGHGSGKHNWKNCCHVPDAESVPARIAGLVEWSESVDFMGLPYRFWCVRELLPTRPLVLLPAYRGFPLVREVRGFVRGGQVVCAHSYWPKGAIEQGFPVYFNGRDEKYDTPPGFAELVERATDLAAFPAGWSTLLERVAAAFAGDGAWSVDVLDTDRGWFVTDCAEAHRSFHWDGCPHADELRKAVA